VEDSPNAIVIATLEGRISQVNRAVENLFGYAADELVGEKIEKLIPARFQEAHREKLKTYASHPGPRMMGVGQELFARRKDGSEFPVEISLGAFETDEGMLVGATVLDITERKEMERMKEEFVSIVSHELRTPLTSIRGSLGLLASGLLGNVSEKGRRMLDIAKNNTDRLVRLLNDILDIERMKSGQLELRKVECDVQDLMTESAEIMQAVADSTGVRLDIAPAPESLWVDPDRLMQVLTNLLGNAIKFSSKGGTVWLTAGKEGEEFVFRVQDEGKGIPSEKLDQIFDQFRQLDASDSRQQSGVGLGLAICRRIVEQHGGRIWVESEEGKGSVCSFALPLQREES